MLFKNCLTVKINHLIWGRLISQNKKGNEDILDYKVSLEYWEKSQPAPTRPLHFSPLLRLVLDGSSKVPFPKPGRVL